MMNRMMKADAVFVARAAKSARAVCYAKNTRKGGLIFSTITLRI